mmetsp:Transcript_39571/g.88030  ORF Transcript_39571/g.88030 Transcript_39571/m.88030 type:complete len:249 (+) Transcript_39571:79-825(+)
MALENKSIHRTDEGQQDSQPQSPSQTEELSETQDQQQKDNAGAVEGTTGAQPESKGGTDGAEPSSSSTETDDQKLAKAEALKAEGNQLYGEGKYQEAADKYNEAIDTAPPEHKATAVYFANLAACDLKLEGHAAQAVENCSCALELDPKYSKALMRRSVAYEQLDNLDNALADAKQLLELEPDNAWAKSTAVRLEPIVREKHEKLKDEMLGKLKDLGNSLLGKFGLSLDNFKAEKDPSTGGYNIQFKQ